MLCSGNVQYEYLYQAPNGCVELVGILVKPYFYTFALNPSSNGFSDLYR